MLLLMLLLLGAAADHASDVLVMQSLKQGITTNNQNWTDPDPCNWNGTKCDASGNVVSLRVRGFQLTGTVTPDINQLTQLQYLELNFNNFSGAMPSLAGLSNLQYAYLDDNDFESIPGDFFTGLTNIEALYLDNNPNLNKSVGCWSIPAELAAAKLLTNLSMNDACIVGALPSFLGLMSSLQFLALAYNGLVGGIPSSFASSNLQVLELNNMAMNGSIAPVGGMLSLKTLWLQVNEFTGAVPEGLTRAAGLTSLRLNNNLLVGQLPLGLSSLPLTDVTLNDNTLDGELPALPAAASGGTFVYDNTTFCGGPGVACSVAVSSLLDFLAAAGYPQAVASTWVGADPCGWTGVTCNANGAVVSLILPSDGLLGTISPSLANLTSLVTIILKGNNLTGPVPDGLVGLKALKTLDVSDNNITGPLPTFPATVAFTYAGNALVGTGAAASSPGQTTGSSPNQPGSAAPRGPSASGASGTANGTTIAGGRSKSASSSLAPIVGGVVGAFAFVLVAAGIAVFFLVWKKKHNSFMRVQNSSNTVAVVHPQRDSGSDPDVLKLVVGNQAAAASTTTMVGAADGNAHRVSDEVHVVEDGNMLISIQVLRAVTNNFAEENVLGRGGFGVVYKGELEDGTKIAVKRMEASVVSSKGLKEFQAEIEVLTKVKHRHLVGLLGYCADGAERLLVYEYLPNGPLSHHLFDYLQFGMKPLAWSMRLSIALDVARGLEYLHDLAQKSFIHRDLKPSNILLTDDFRAKVSDFGLVKLAPEGKFSVETRLAGTFGYLAPEYAVTGRVTTKVDVFSFGVVLMELITGRRALDETQPEENMHLVTWFRRMNGNKDSFLAAIDSTIQVDDETFKTICVVAELAGHCTSREPFQRPDMGHAVNVLAPLVEKWKPTDMGGESSAGIDLDVSLPQALKQWQAFDGDSIQHQGNPDDTKSSLPTWPTGFADSFTSDDGR
ncbi:unnamed protein product [Sphagnum troendelagicum]|uniref:Protein kinase domain-containing protein n=1 Tax=Sphagnum troendelagicum TaxID=128251 RepID=A0ABP0U4B1_9BRYO